MEDSKDVLFDTLVIRSDKGIESCVYQPLRADDPDGRTIWATRRYPGVLLAGPVRACGYSVDAYHDGIMVASRRLKGTSTIAMKPSIYNMLQVSFLQLDEEQGLCVVGTRHLSKWKDVLVLLDSEQPDLLLSVELWRLEMVKLHAKLDVSAASTRWGLQDGDLVLCGVLNDVEGLGLLQMAIFDYYNGFASMEIDLPMVTSANFFAGGACKGCEAYRGVITVPGLYGVKIAYYTKDRLPNELPVSVDGRCYCCTPIPVAPSSSAPMVYWKRILGDDEIPFLRINEDCPHTWLELKHNVRRVWKGMGILHADLLLKADRHFAAEEVVLERNRQNYLRRGGLYDGELVWRCPRRGVVNIQDLPYDLAFPEGVASYEHPSDMFPRAMLTISGMEKGVGIKFIAGNPSFSARLRSYTFPGPWKTVASAQRFGEHKLGECGTLVMSVNSELPLGYSKPMPKLGGSLGGLMDSFRDYKDGQPTRGSVLTEPGLDITPPVLYGGESVIPGDGVLACDYDRAHDIAAEQAAERAFRSTINPEFIAPSYAAPIVFGVADPSLAFDVDLNVRPDVPFGSKTFRLSDILRDYELVVPPGCDDREIRHIASTSKGLWIKKVEGSLSEYERYIARVTNEKLS